MPPFVGTAAYTRPLATIRKMKKSNKIILDENWGVFIGSFTNNIYHRHYAIQLNIPLFGELEIIRTNSVTRSSGISIIPSNAKHKINSEHPFILILINPLEFVYEVENTLMVNPPEILKLQNASLDYMTQGLDDRGYEKLIRKSLNSLVTTNYRNIDERIEEGLGFLKKHRDRIVSLSEISKICHLSESRFLHLFKSEMKITYRRAQLWYRVSESIHSLFRRSITETAYEFGFTDSAHYSRTFKENFGFSPRDFLKNSQFIQV